MRCTLADAGAVLALLTTATGFPQVFHLRGGITAWIAAGQPTVFG